LRYKSFLGYLGILGSLDTLTGILSPATRRVSLDNTEWEKKLILRIKNGVEFIILPKLEDKKIKKL